MSYTPKEWVCGETITADGLNNIEDGIQEALDCCGGGGALAVNIVSCTSGSGAKVASPIDPSTTCFALDKTWNEIKSAYDANMPIFAHMTYSENGQTRYERIELTQIVLIPTSDSTVYGVRFGNADDGLEFSAESADGVLELHL